MGRVGIPSGKVGEVTDLRQLRIFQTLSQTRSFTETAKIMSVTQSAVSHSIKALETTLGVTLFDRNGKRLQLTAEGSTLLLSACEILREVGRATQQLQNLRSGELTTVRFGTTDSICEFILPDVLCQLKQFSPEADLQLVTAESNEVLDQLCNGTIDIALSVHYVESDGGHSGLQSVELFQDSLLLVTSNSHPWVRGTPPAGNADLAGQRYLLPGERSTTAQMVREWFNHHSIELSNCVEIPSLSAAIRLVETGFGVGVAPAWAIDRELKAGTLHAFPFLQENLRRTWMISMRPTHRFSPLEAFFIRALKEGTSSLADSTL
jgi:LysR family transcriptional regulator, low CO2-responsive transcriptional regulator